MRFSPRTVANGTLDGCAEVCLASDGAAIVVSAPRPIQSSEVTDSAPGVSTTAAGPQAARISAEARRRRPFAVISHPDAGKSTLTEALVLHAKAITEAGAIHGKSGRRATVSDWMEMEKARGISITSTAL